jgi:hypothetical protein
MDVVKHATGKPSVRLSFDVHHGLNENYVGDFQEQNVIVQSIFTSMIPLL